MLDKVPSYIFFDGSIPYLLASSLRALGENPCPVELY
jgi:hypothetical protein